MTARWCAHVRGQTDDSALIPSLLIHVEHVRSFSEDIPIAYRKDKGGKIAFDEPTTEGTPHQIFSAVREPSWRLTTLSADARSSLAPFAEIG
jgi:hypothetical protein